MLWDLGRRRTNQYVIGFEKNKVFVVPIQESVFSENLPELMKLRLIIYFPYHALTTVTLRKFCEKLKQELATPEAKLIDGTYA